MAKRKNDVLRVNEIFHSVQGEGTRAGDPCVFVRLTGCHLRCRYCDTEYAFHEGGSKTIDRVVADVTAFGCPLVEITGGEPLLQPNVHPLMTRLCDEGFEVLIETSGACDIGPCDERVARIVDLKTPGSGESHHNEWSNVGHLRPRDEVKFVICDRADYEWSRRQVREYGLCDRVAAVLFGPAERVAPGREIAGVEGLAIERLAGWILEDRLAVRLQTQLHKQIWGPTARGV
ncbi:MAG: 7-carboxy-7-deazaguanine synthase [Phycisphaeraceae bacterium]|nr:7-carboxy-7-deazaguanine synthase [Phycisphaeraceae bacterium]